MSDPPAATADPGTSRDDDRDVPVAANPDQAMYADLAAPFEITFRDLRGGVELEYVTGEQVTTRLNETLGFMNWSFRIVEHGVHAEADECWALGELTVTLDDRTVTRQQFGSQKIKRSRSSGTPLDIGFDLKGAATDALKKCASLIGVALYLWKKEPPAGLGTGGRPQPPGQGQPQGQLPAGQDPPAPRAPRVQALASTADLDRYEIVRAEAVAAGFTAGWIELDPAGWTAENVTTRIAQMEKHLSRAGVGS